MNEKRMREQAIEAVRQEIHAGAHEPAHLAGAAIKVYEQEVDRLRGDLRRLASMEAFHVGTAHVTEEGKQRVAFARESLLVECPSCNLRTLSEHWVSGVCESNHPERDMLAGDKVEVYMGSECSFCGFKEDPDA